tara:strand:+ start:122 stop:562 length:441 start_codon:yes stop_codon:yes gene_type:complete
VPKSRIDEDFSIKEISKSNSKTVNSSNNADNVLIIIINSPDAAALFILKFEKITRDGTIIKPPPIPNKPVNKPTKSPSKNIEILLFFEIFKFLFIRIDSPEKKITIENKNINKVFLFTFKNPISSGIRGNINDLVIKVKITVGTKK